MAADEKEQQQFEELLGFLNQRFVMEGEGEEEQKKADRVNLTLRRVGVRYMGQAIKKGPFHMRLLMGDFLFEGLCEALEMVGIDWDFDLTWWNVPS
jgi:hypothetical protein